MQAYENELVACFGSGHFSGNFQGTIRRRISRVERKTGVSQMVVFPQT